MEDDKIIDTAIEFVEKINRRDFQGLQSLMTNDFLSIADDGSEFRGDAEGVNGIEQYTKDCPDFQIHISDVYVKSDTVSIVGRTTGSCDDESRGVEIRKRRIYQIVVDGGLAKSFRYAVPDSEENRAQLGIAKAQKATM